MLTITLWGIAALTLLILEILSGTFILLFFAIAAAITALASLAGLEAVHWQLVLFAASGIGALALFRKKLLRRSGQGHGKGAPGVDVGSFAVVDSDLEPGGQGVATYQGSPWSVTNAGSAPLARGQRARIIRTEGVRLFVEAAE